MKKMKKAPRAELLPDLGDEAIRLLMGAAFAVSGVWAVVAVVVGAWTR